MKFFTRPGILFLLTTVILFNGCSIFTRKLPERKAAEIWDKVRENTGTVVDFSAKSEVTIESGFKVIPVNAKIFFRAPDWITLRTYELIKLKLIEASLQKNNFQVYSLFTNEYFTGNLDSVDISQRFKLPLPDMDLRSAWLRLFNPLEPESKVAEVRENGNSYILVYPSGDLVREIWIDGSKMLVKRENVYNTEGSLKYYIAYDHYKKKNGVRFPRTIEMGDIDTGVRLTVETGKFEINQNVMDSDLLLSVPPSVQRIKLNR